MTTHPTGPAAVARRALAGGVLLLGAYAVCDACVATASGERAAVEPRVTDKPDPAGGATNVGPQCRDTLPPGGGGTPGTPPGGGGQP